MQNVINFLMISSIL